MSSISNCHQLGNFFKFRPKNLRVPPSRPSKLDNLVLHKIQDFQDRYTQDQDQDQDQDKIQVILSRLKSFENIDELIFCYEHRPKKKYFRKNPPLLEHFNLNPRIYFKLIYVKNRRFSKI